MMMVVVRSSMMDHSTITTASDLTKLISFGTKNTRQTLYLFTQNDDGKQEYQIVR